MLNRKGWAFFLLSLTIFTLLAQLLFLPSKTYSANGVPDITFVTSSGNKIYFDDSFKITAEILDRAHIKLSVAGSNADYIVLGNAKLRTYVEGIYFDDNLDSDWVYKIQRDVTDPSEAFTHIDLRRDNISADANDPRVDNPDYIDALDTSNFYNQYLQDAELTVVIDEDDLGDNCSEDYPVVLDVDDKNADRVSWQCVTSANDDNSFSIVKGYTGMFLPETSWLGFDNFNIVYRYNGKTGSDARLEYVSEDGGGKFDFVFCDKAGNGKSDIFVRQDCSKGEYIAIQPDDIDKQLEKVTIKDDDGDEVTAYVAGIENATNQAVSPTTTTQDSATCEGGTSLSWILCPVVEGLLDASQKIAEGPLKDLLIFDSLTSSSGVVKDVWQNFVTIANVFFVIGFMFVIFAQATSINVEAYTIKRMLPRLAVGIILVQLSFFFSSILIDIFNVLGAGVAGLILTPINGLPNFGTEILPIFDDSAVGQAAANTVLVTITAANLGAIVGGVGSLLFALAGILPTILFILLAVVITLVLRNAVIAMCIVLSPIALVAWILPNTERVFKQWLDIFTKTLIMYPLIMAALAFGRFAGALIVEGGNTQNGSGGIFDTIASIVVNVIPYAFIPLSYKFAGTLLGSLGGLIANLRNRRGGGGGGGGGRQQGAYQTFLNRRRARIGAGQGQGFLNRRVPGYRRATSRLARGYGGGFTLNPLHPVRNARAANLRASSQANARFRQLEGASYQQLRDENLLNNRDVLTALGIDDETAAGIPGRRGTDIRAIRNQYRHLNTPEARSAARLAAAEQGYIRSEDNPLDSPSFLSAARDMRDNPALAEDHIRKMAEFSGRSGRHTLATLRYDGNGGLIEDESLESYLSQRTGGQLVNTHSSSQEAVADSLERNLFTPGLDEHGAPILDRDGNPIAISDENTARQVGELLASQGLDPQFRARLEGMHDTALTAAPVLHTLITETMENLRGI